MRKQLRKELVNSGYMNSEVPYYECSVMLTDSELCDGKAMLMGLYLDLANEAIAEALKYVLTAGRGLYLGGAAWALNINETIIGVEHKLQTYLDKCHNRYDSWSGQKVVFRTYIEKINENSLAFKIVFVLDKLKIADLRIKCRLVYNDGHTGAVFEDRDSAMLRQLL